MTANKACSDAPPRLFEASTLVFVEQEVAIFGLVELEGYPVNSHFVIIFLILIILNNFNIRIDAFLLPYMIQN